MLARHEAFWQIGAVLAHVSAVVAPNPIPGQFWVYIVQSEDGALYVGQSSNVPERLRKHRYRIGSKFTHDHAGARLVFIEGPFTLSTAVSREAQLKRWSRAKKEALVMGDATALHQLSRSRD